MPIPVTSSDIAEERFAEAFIPRREIEQSGRESRQRIIDEIRHRKLIERAWELEVDGYTVLTPDEVGGADIGAGLLEACLQMLDRKAGARPDLQSQGDRADLISPFGNVQAEVGILGEDPAFEQALLNPAVLALIRYLLGESCALIHQSLFVKNPGPDHLPLHTDQDQTAGASPFPHYAQVANATWALTDYTTGNGTTCFVPGSHKLCRAPTRAEATDLSLFVPVAAKAGSVIIWHGNTWHGAFRRQNPGVRVSIVQYFGRWFLAGMNTSTITAEMIDRNPPEFEQLVRSSSRMDGVGSVKFQAAKETLYG
jgi:hypothetical protein